jgi:four helix bundle protein
MELENLEVYKMSSDIAQRIWDEVKKWSHFEKDTVGKQLVRAADSISANISEGFGRYHFKDARNFLYFARGSLFETKSWLAKAKARSLISQETHYEIDQQLIRLSIKLNNYIKSIGQKTSYKDQIFEDSFNDL